MISDISWKASYTLNDNHIQGWLSISNDTGENISDMNLTCISGETKKFETRVMLMAADSMSKVSQEEDSSGRYLFKYNKTFNIENNEVKKLLFIDEELIKILSPFETLIKFELNIFIDENNKLTPLEATPFVVIVFESMRVEFTGKADVPKRYIP